jgi:hypothetical protein
VVKRSQNKQEMKAAGRKGSKDEGLDERKRERGTECRRHGQEKHVTHIKFFDRDTKVLHLAPSDVEMRVRKHRQTHGHDDVPLPLPLWRKEQGLDGEQRMKERIILKQ